MQAAQGRSEIRGRVLGGGRRARCRRGLGDARPCPAGKWPVVGNGSCPQPLLPEFGPQRPNPATTPSQRFHEESKIGGAFGRSMTRIRTSAGRPQCGQIRGGAATSLRLRTVGAASGGGSGSFAIWRRACARLAARSRLARMPKCLILTNHPEQIDVNGPGIKIPQFWNHVNGIEHNAQLDQVMLNIRGNSEVFVVDHQTTTAQAAATNGGRYNRVCPRA